MIVRNALLGAPVRRISPARDRALPYRTLVDAWRRLAFAQGFELSEYVVGSPARRLLCARIGSDRPQQIMIAAGTHGDEPASPWTLLDLVRSGKLDPRYGYMLWCCVNPTGYEDGRRENAERVDINRTFGVETGSPEARLIAEVVRDETFALVIDLHEDWEAQGFYCYEAVRTGIAYSFGARILASIRAADYPLQPLGPGFDLGYSQDYLETACRINTGIVSLQYDDSVECADGGKMLTAHLLRARRTHHAITVESPKSVAWRDRLAMQSLAVHAAIEQIPAERTHVISVALT